MYCNTYETLFKRQKSLKSNTEIFLFIIFQKVKNFNLLIKVTVPEWLTGCPAKAMVFGHAGSNPVCDVLFEVFYFFTIYSLPYFFLTVFFFEIKGFKQMYRNFYSNIYRFYFVLYNIYNFFNDIK